ncbi:MAG: hypothetical protein JST16_01215 [Bdellovibrionales bacterium]|nr:hypothetical protein [Bdellovibrionales bacterium]
MQRKIIALVSLFAVHGAVAANLEGLENVEKSFCQSMLSVEHANCVIDHLTLAPNLKSEQVVAAVKQFNERTSDSIVTAQAVGGLDDSAPIFAATDAMFAPLGLKANKLPAEIVSSQDVMLEQLDYESTLATDAGLASRIFVGGTIFSNQIRLENGYLAVYDVTTGETLVLSAGYEE